MKVKVKKEKRDAEEAAAAVEEVGDVSMVVPERSYEELLENLNPIAQPMAGRKLTKRLYKCIKKAAKHKNIRRGVKEVQKFINKGEKGGDTVWLSGLGFYTGGGPLGNAQLVSSIVVLAGDTLPIEVYCHVPVMCEERNLPYAYVPSKSDLGAAAGSKRPTCVILLKTNNEYEDAYNDCVEDVQALPLPY